MNVRLPTTEPGISENTEINVKQQQKQYKKKKQKQKKNKIKQKQEPNQTNNNPLPHHPLQDILKTSFTK